MPKMKLNDIKTFIGTSGWMYKHWKGPFYPEKISNEDMLKFYTDHFSTVEVNSTFYRLPTAKTVQNWMNKTPKQFIFVIKTNQYITHRKYLKDGQETVKKFFNIIKILDYKLGPILFQLPPNWNVNLERITEFIKILPKDYLYVFEIRHPSWYIQEIYDLFKDYNIALCIHDFYGEISPLEITANFIYIRFHGAKGHYFGKYSTEQIKHWTNKIIEWIKLKHTVFAYFNNDAFGWAVKNALELKKNLKNI